MTSILTGYRSYFVKFKFVKTSLDKIIPKKFHSKRRLPLRSRGARPPYTDISAEPCPHLPLPVRQLAD
jgi:hypothetical protein